MIYLDRPSIGVPREYMVKGLENQGVQSYFTYMKEAAVLFGASQARAETELKEVVELVMKLANATLPREKKRTPYKPKVFSTNEFTTNTNPIFVRCPTWIWSVAGAEPPD